MKPSEDGPWLKLPLESTPLSKDFIQAANSKGYKTIGEVLAIQVTELVQMDWLTSARLTELDQLVKSFRHAVDIQH